MPVSYIYNKFYHELWCKDSHSGLHRTAPLRLQHPVIENFFVVSNPDNLLSPTIILPDLSPHLVIHHFRNGQTRARIIGPRRRSVFVSHHQRKQTLILRLKPCGLYALTSVPLSDIVDRSVALEEIMGGILSYQELVDVMHENSQDLLSFFERSFLPTVQRQLQWGKILSSGKEIQRKKVHQLANELGISDRYLQKLSLRQLGMSPKMVCKIERLACSLNLTSRHPDLPFSQLALESGYYDQSHMIDEYQQFLRKTPGQLFG
ncbi:MAG: helix-turn-helix domain-containing protein [Bacteroidota bacterium]